MFHCLVVSALTYYNVKDMLTLTHPVNNCHIFMNQGQKPLQVTGAIHCEVLFVMSGRSRTHTNMSESDMQKLV